MNTSVDLSSLMVVTKKRFIKANMIVATVLGVVTGGLLAFLFCKKKAITRPTTKVYGASLPIISWNDQNKAPLSEDIKGQVLVWDGKEWNIISQYSTPTYSKNGKRLHYGREIKGWGYLPLGE